MFVQFLSDGLQAHFSLCMQQRNLICHAFNKIVMDPGIKIVFTIVYNYTLRYVSVNCVQYQKTD